MAINIPLKAVFDDRELKKGLSSLNSFGKAAGVAVGAAVVAGGVALAQFAKESITAAEGVQQANNRLAQVAESMGLFGDQTQAVTDRLIKYAEANEINLGTDAELIKSTQAKLLTFKELAASADETGGAFDRATMAALDLAAAGFGSAETNATQLGKALQDPVKGLTALTRSGVTFTDEQKNLIKSLVESGDVLKAQDMILQAIETQVGGTAEATATASEKMALAFQNIYEQVGMSLLPAFEAMLPTVTDELAPALADLAENSVPLLIGMMDGLTQVLSDMADPTTVLGGAMENLGEALGIASTGFSTMSETAPAFSDFLGGIADVIGDVIAGFNDIFTQIQAIIYVQEALARGDWAAALEGVLAGLSGNVDGYVSSVQSAEAAQEAFGVSANQVGSGISTVGESANNAAIKMGFLANQTAFAAAEFRRFAGYAGVEIEIDPFKKKDYGGGGTAKKDPVKEFFKKLQDDIDKQAAAIKLSDLGLSQPLIEKILGSGDDWQAILENIVKGGKSAAEEMQNLFNQTEEGLKAIEEQAKVAEEQLAKMAQVQLDFYDRLVAKYEANQEAIKALNADVQTLFDNFREASTVEESLGEAEQAVYDLTQGLRDLITAQDNTFMTEKNKKKVQEYLSAVSADMRAVAQQRDELASRLSEAKQVFKDYFDSIVGSVDITKFKGKSESIIKQLRKQVQAQAKFQEDIKKLRATGLSQQALQQIQAAGVEAGGATAQALLTGGQGAIDEVNSLYAQLGDIATSATEAQLGPMFGAGVDLSNGLIAGLEAQSDQLKIVAEGLALDFADSFESILNKNIKRLARPDPEAWAAFAAQYAAAQEAIAATLRPGEMVQYGPGDMVNGIQLPSQPISDPGSRGSINIQVTAGMGADGADIGRRIVDEIKKYERRNGSVFVPAVM
jgi:hypothetical protein